MRVNVYTSKIRHELIGKVVEFNSIGDKEVVGDFEDVRRFRFQLRYDVVHDLELPSILSEIAQAVNEESDDEDGEIFMIDTTVVSEGSKLFLETEIASEGELSDDQLDHLMESFDEEYLDKDGWGSQFLEDAVYESSPESEDYFGEEIQSYEGVFLDAQYGEYIEINKW